MTDQISTGQSSAPSASSVQDRTWVEQALIGNEVAFQRLMNKYREPIWHHIRKMIRNDEEVDDLVQEAFIKAFSSLGSYSTQFAFSTWLYKIATNHTIDFLRKRRLKTISIDKPVQTKDGEMELEIPDVEYRPDRHIVEDQRNRLIEEAIAKLPEKYHRVIVMRHQQEMSYEEIADQLSLPLGTVKAHIFRAREMLYRFLKDNRTSLEF
ncbi:MAG: sigma-70 family RNA polymerase sigma factor [Bacteroidetes Order II. Incertae sedis bacterium]|nr:sigma-70 family RNA polymerase sigma factor [Bacteroidetes Order II. bacterium]